MRPNQRLFFYCGPAVLADSQAERADQRDVGVAGGRMLPVRAAVCTNTCSHRGG